MSESKSKLPDAIKAILEPPAPLDKIERYLARWVSDYETVKAMFLEKLDARPTQALEWSDDLHSAAARLDLATLYLEDIKAHRERNVEKETADDSDSLADLIIDDARRHVFSGASSPRASTSAMANIMAVKKLQACAEFVTAMTRGR